MTLELPRVVWDELRARLEAAYPDEGCGLLAGVPGPDGAVVSKLVPLVNEERETPRRRYVIAPAAWRRAEDECRGVGLELLGVYHSHPDSVLGATPSEHDRAQAWPGLSYVIVAVRDGRAEVGRSWRLADQRDRFAEETLTILDRAVV